MAKGSEKGKIGALVIGGTSAGASIMADTMIVDGDSDGAPRLGELELG